MAARGQSPPGFGLVVEESEVVGVWGRRSAHTQEERFEPPPYLLPPPQLRMQGWDLAPPALPLRFVSLPLGPSLLLPFPWRHSPLFLAC